MRRQTSRVLLLSLALSSLALAAGCLCGPKTDSALKAEVDGYFSLPAGTKEYAAAPAGKIPFAVGQWVIYRHRSRNEQSYTRLSVVGEEGPGTIWLQMEDATYEKRGLSMMLIEGYDPQNPGSMLKIAKWIAYDYEKGKASELPQMFYRNLAENVLRQVNVDIKTETREDVTVPAGVFRGALRVDAKVSGVVNGETVTWFHAAVPIYGYVKSQMADGSDVSELVEFGMTGAERKIQTWEPAVAMPMPFGM
jgi:hypothetical protein